MRWMVTGLALLWLAGCVGRVPAACVLPSQQRMVVAELFFGRDVPHRGSVSDAEWSDFATQVIAASFPDGFTTFDGDGQWRNPNTKAAAREPTKILLVAAQPTADLASRLETVMAEYRRRFDQISVGLVTDEACGAF